MLLLQLDFSPTLGDPMDCSLAGLSVYGILQARLLEWVAMPPSRGPARPSDWTCAFCVSCIAGRVPQPWATLEAILVTIHWIYLFKYFNFNLSMFVFCRYFSCKQYSSYGYFFSFQTMIFFFLCSSVQFSSVAQPCPNLCDPMNHSAPGLPVHHQFPEFTHTHAHRVGDTIQPFHPLSSPSLPAPNAS